ncbi:MAG: hypothetical protein ACE5E6_09065 [Phycisphaerae bacterium]
MIELRSRVTDRAGIGARRRHQEQIACSGFTGLWATAVLLTCCKPMMDPCGCTRLVGGGGAGG